MRFYTKKKKNAPENTQTVAGQGFLVALDLCAELGGHGHDAVAELNLRAAVDDALWGALHDNEAFSVGLGLLLHHVHLYFQKKKKKKKCKTKNAINHNDLL